MHQLSSEKLKLSLGRGASLFTICFGDIEDGKSKRQCRGSELQGRCFKRQGRHLSFKVDVSSFRVDFSGSRMGMFQAPG